MVSLLLPKFPSSMTHFTSLRFLSISW